MNHLRKSPETESLVSIGNFARAVLGSKFGKAIAMSLVAVSFLGLPKSAKGGDGGYP